MPIVIDGDTLSKNVKRLPKEAFFIDTNILISFKDPFAASYKNASKEKLNSKYTELLLLLKSTGFNSYTTFSVALEFYKYVQVNSYIIYKSGLSKNSSIKFDTSDFKKLREVDQQFMTTWDLQIKSFNKLFSKNFIIIDESMNPKIVLSEFLGSQIDFGDHLLYEVVKLYPKYKCIFTNDSDFYSIDDDDLHIITFNKNMITQAKSDDNLLKIDK